MAPALSKPCKLVALSVAAVVALLAAPAAAAGVKCHLTDSAGAEATNVVGPADCTACTYTGNDDTSNKEIICTACDNSLVPTPAATAENVCKAASTAASSSSSSDHGKGSAKSGSHSDSEHAAANTTTTTHDGVAVEGAVAAVVAAAAAAAALAL